jgi:hypothetical protein
VERNDLTDDLDRRLRASRPAAAHVEEHAFDGALLSRLRREPIAARRTVPRKLAMPLAAAVIVVATAAVVLGGIPGNVAGPPSADAITQETLHWLTPPPGTVLHVRSVDTTGGVSTTREFWQSADDPSAERQLVQGAQAYETSGAAIYDPATNTIYDAPQTATSASDAVKAKRAANDPSSSVPGNGKDGTPSGDPMVAKVRTLLQDGTVAVTGRELHNGVDAWAISLKPEFTDAARPAWTLWVSVADGKPIELRDPGEAGGQVIVWPVYETLAGDTASQLATLEGAHPSAHVVHDLAQLEAADQRLLPPKP